MAAESDRPPLGATAANTALYGMTQGQGTHYSGIKEEEEFLNTATLAPDEALSGTYYNGGGHETESYASGEDEGDDEGDEGAMSSYSGASSAPDRGSSAASAGNRTKKSPQRAKGKGKKSTKPLTAAAARNQETWNLRLEQLRQYHSENGDFAVPRKYEANPQLGYWVNEQRKQIMFWVRGQPSTLTQERMGALFQMGFPLPRISTNPSPVLNAPVMVASAGDAWNVRLNELREYRVQRGDYAVPRKYEPNPQLGYWVNEQRKQFGFFFKGQKSTLSQARMRALYKIGFPFSIPKRGATGKSAKPSKIGERPTRQESEEHRTESQAALCIAKLAAGSPGEEVSVRLQGVNSKNITEDRRTEEECSLSTVSTPAVVAAIVSPPARQSSGSNGMMTRLPEQSTDVKDPKTLGSNKQDVWEQRFEELRLFKEEQGHCLVPQKYDSNRKLGLWVSQQRTQYRYWVNGDVSSLTKEKIRALKELDFVWNGRAGSADAAPRGGGGGITKRAYAQTLSDSAEKRGRISSDQLLQRSASPHPDKRAMLLRSIQEMKAQLQVTQVELGDARQEKAMLRNQLKTVKGSLINVLGPSAL
eukprot:CAMPEP_0113531498 /NCGR_PEP_ID=MMETSP0015_2-20120614/3528_1 /TAXON_ID=2838 /ORGANISM="Odontella" /LENGTH=587 /DNA_ID=CAMNT_0000430337 /DNA_START=76 /DNA_END=1839 /DNA_ORIENTATION=+ /assembly_acc=CAM_ASM_000160